MNDYNVIPPVTAIAAAIAAAEQSPCSKSKRGASVFHPATTTIYGVGFNGQPSPFACSGSEACRASCSQLCVHAEVRAIRRATFGSWTRELNGLEMLHVKVVDGMLVSSGSPSCVQCSREIVDVGLSAMWLYENDAWKRYTAVDFHQRSIDSIR